MGAYNSVSHVGVQLLWEPVLAVDWLAGLRGWGRTLRIWMALVAAHSSSQDVG